MRCGVEVGEQRADFNFFCLKITFKSAKRSILRLVRRGFVLVDRFFELYFDGVEFDLGEWKLLVGPLALRPLRRLVAHEVQKISLVLCLPHTTRNTIDHTHCMTNLRETVIGCLHDPANVQH